MSDTLLEDIESAIRRRAEYLDHPVSGIECTQSTYDTIVRLDKFYTVRKVLLRKRHADELFGLPLTVNAELTEPFAVVD